MNFIKYISLVFILIIPSSSFAGFGAFTIKNTDLSGFAPTSMESNSPQLSAYYDLRNRKSFIQITNHGNGVQGPVTIHVQIFQHDRGCDELDFFDTLTLNDTVVYDLDNIIKNNGTSAPINLNDDSYGYVVVTTSSNSFNGPGNLIGNFRIIDDAGYEYRSNMASTFTAILPENSIIVSLFSQTDHIINFNTIDNAKFADVVGYAFQHEIDSPSNIFDKVTNIDEGYSFDIFVFDMNEDPLSCDRRNFACGNVMNYGINEDYPASIGNDLLCPGGGLANPEGGYIGLVNGTDLDASPPLRDDTVGGDALDIFVGYIGINNGDGTGSMDLWHQKTLNVNELPDIPLFEP